MDERIDQWVEQSAIRLGPGTYIPQRGQALRLAALNARLAKVQIVFLGETNHFVHQKTDFRLWWLRHLAKHRRLVIGEELGWSDGRRVASYVRTGDAQYLDQVATFGHHEELRKDRDDWPTGVFADLAKRYPHALMKAEHARFYRALRKLDAVEDYFGFDIDSPPGGAYRDLSNRRAELDRAGLPIAFWTGFQRVPDETLAEETQRLRRLVDTYADAPGFERVREDLLSLIESLDYTAAFKDAADYEATRPSMAYREQSMKRRVDDVLARCDPDHLIVLMGHAFHLAKDDQYTEEKGVGPGGGQVSSLGHYLVQDRELEATSVWMIYGQGRDSQPLPDLPQIASYPDNTLNTQLLRNARPMVLPLGQPCPFDDAIQIGHLYNLVASVQLCRQADAIMFFPQVTPLAPER